jgi:hypothetical protein
MDMRSEDGGPYAAQPNLARLMDSDATPGVRQPAICPDD